MLAGSNRFSPFPVALAAVLAGGSLAFGCGQDAPPPNLTPQVVSGSVPPELGENDDPGAAPTAVPEGAGDPLANPQAYPGNADFDPAGTSTQTPTTATPEDPSGSDDPTGSPAAGNPAAGNPAAGNPAAGNPAGEPGSWHGAIRQRVAGQARFQPLPDQELHQLEGELSDTDQTHPRDSSYYDEYRFRVPAGSPVQVFASSEDFDPYLYMFFATEDGKLDRERPAMQNDDLQDGNLNAYLKAEPADKNAIVVVWVNSVRPGEVGTYDLRIRLTE